MKKDIKVVIGAGYGDEGKGLMTDYFTKEDRNCLVVLSNGGAQRGHTVTRGGIRHVFHHFGSGSLSGADTYLSSFYILNPMYFVREYEELVSCQREPAVFRDRSCIWTTPFDMMINQIAEESRGDLRHGSCGAGIWETVVRSEKMHTPLDTFSGGGPGGVGDLRDYLREIRDCYLPGRLKELGVDCLPEQWKGLIEDEGLIDHFIEDVFFMMEHTVPCGREVLRPYDRIIFENGQGLLLDRSRPDKKHTTPSNTGLENAAQIIRDTGLSKCPVEVCYVTRTYLTRHGAGPFPGECRKEEINPAMTDRTNMPNPFQGTLRYGIIDTARLMQGMITDFTKYTRNDPWDMTLAITHLNETDGKWNGNQAIREDIFRRAGVKRIYYSDGMTKETVREENRQ